MGEHQLYENFKKLSDDYIIFHSVEWLKKNKNVRFGESDYVIFNKNRGIICLEVKHGGIKSKDGRLYQLNRKTNESFQINPMEQANRSKYYFIDKLKPIFNQYGFNYPIHSVVWLTGINRNELRGNLPHNYWDNGNTFFQDNIVDLSKTFDKIYKFFNMEKLQVPKLLSNKIRDALLPEFHAFPSLQNVINQNDYQFNRMTREQNYLLDYLEEQKSAAIQGGAGTGKTMLAIEKARRLSKNEDVVFLCFNSLLTESLKKRYSDELPNVTFTNLYSLAAKAYKRHIDEDDIITFLQNFYSFPSTWKFKSIVIDEGQDFTNEQVKLLKEIAILNEGSFYIFYDKNQLVQQRNELEWLQEMECQLVLSYNCRNTQNIAKTSTSPLGIEKVKMRLNVEGEMPIYHNTKTKKDLIEWLEERIRHYSSEGISLQQMVILTTKTIEKSILSDEKYIGKFKLSWGLEDNSILFTTARKFKGLEADVVFIIDIDASQFRGNEDRRVFYVAASRAKSVLELIPTLTDIEEEELFYEISEGNSTRNITLIRDLNVKPI